MDNKIDIAWLAHRLGKAVKTSRGYNCLCPAHNDRNPSLSLSIGREGKLLAYCYAGCSFEEIIGSFPTGIEADQIYTTSLAKERKENTNPQSVIFERLWETSEPAEGTVVEAYLQARGYKGSIPSTLRYLHDAFHAPTQTYRPCMVGAIMRWPHKLIGIHRTYLKPDGSAKAKASPNKMMLGRSKGGGVFLQTVGETLIIAEGIETALSIALAYPTTGIWAALSAFNMSSLILPPFPLAQTVIIAADSDPAGRDAAKQSAELWCEEGRQIEVAFPPEGKDFNDILRGV